jgi:hypothetical protein
MTMTGNQIILHAIASNCDGRKNPSFIERFGGFCSNSEEAETAMRQLNEQRQGIDNVHTVEMVIVAINENVSRPIHQGTLSEEQIVLYGTATEKQQDDSLPFIARFRGFCPTYEDANIFMRQNNLSPMEIDTVYVVELIIAGINEPIIKALP